MKRSNQTWLAASEHSIALSPAGALVLALVPAAMLAMMLRDPVWDVDIFWQLKLGELISARGSIVRAEPFAANHLGEPLPALAWLGQVIMAQVRLWFGWDGLRLLNAWCWLGGFWLAAAAAMRRGATREMALAALPAALLVARSNASVRPQSFALLAFGLVLWLQQRKGPAWGRIVPITLILVLWQNAHPSVAVAVAWFGASAGWDWLRLLARRLPTPPWEGTVLALAAACAMAATPDGLSLFSTAAANAAISQAVGVSEWLPLWAPVNGLLALAVGVVAGLTGWLLVRRQGPIDHAVVIPWLALLGLSMIAARFTLFWAVAVIPVLAPLLPRLTSMALPAWFTPLAVLVVSPVLTVTWPTRFTETIPVTQLERLYASGVHGTIFAHFPWGGAVIDRGYPAWHVALDGRYYRYPAKEWQRYYGMVSGTAGLAVIGPVYRPAAYVLDPVWNIRLIAELRADPAHWRQFSADSTAVIFVPIR